MPPSVLYDSGSPESWNTMYPGIPRISHNYIRVPESYLQPVSPRFLVYFLVSQVDMKYYGVTKYMKYCMITYYINFHSALSVQ